MTRTPAISQGLAFCLPPGVLLWLRRLSVVLCLGLKLLCCVCAFGEASLCAATADAPELRTANRAREVVHVFHPSRAAAVLVERTGPVTLLTQTLAAVFLCGGIMHRLRQDSLLMEHLATLVLKVGFIALLPSLANGVLTASDAASEWLGGSLVGGARLSLDELEENPEPGPLMETLWAHGEQWALLGSPVLDGLAESWEEGGDDERVLREAWNWAQAPLLASKDEPGRLWATGAGLERATRVHDLAMGCSVLVQATFILHYLAEMLRLILFHAACAFAPFCVAALGSHAFGGGALRGLSSIVGLACWPLAWALGSAGSQAVLSGSNQLQQWMVSAALYPKADTAGALVNLAQAGPYLSWWSLGLLAVVTLGVCVWMLGVLFAAPLLLHKLLGAGLRRWS